jgi:hypothetical protein
MDSFLKVCNDLIRYFTASKEILIIDPMQFRTLILLMKSSSELRATFPAYSIVDITTIIPDFERKLHSSSLQHPSSLKWERLGWELGVKYLIDEYAHSWIPLGSPDYTTVLEQSFLEHTNMEVWQRGIRALHSMDKIELLHLSLDPDVEVRSIAQFRLKQLEQ